MRHRRSTRTGTFLRGLGAVTAAVAVALVPAVTSLPAAAADTVVHTADFEDGTSQGWGGRGATATVVEGGRDSAHALAVTGRTANWNGAQLPVGTLVTEGTYTVEAWVRLADPAAAPIDLNLGMQQPGAANEYPWVGVPEEVDGVTWVRLAGTYDVLPDTPPTNLYVESGEGQLDNFLIDDVTIVGQGPAPVGDVVWSLDFDDESHTPWTPSGGPDLAYVDDGDGGKALSITREADYEAIQSPVGVLESGVEYTASMRAKLAPGSDPAAIRFVVKPAYDWVGNTTLTTEWSEITGTFTLGDGADPLESQVYLGISQVPEANGPVTVVVDDLLIMAPPTDVSLTFDFEDGTQGWVPRDSTTIPTVAVTTDEAHGGAQSLKVSDRAGQGDGAGYDLTGVFETGVTYDITGFVKMAEGVAPDEIWLSARTVSDSTEDFGTVVQVPDVGDSAWVEVTGSYTMPAADEVFLYFETSYTDGSNGDFLIDDVTIASREQGTVQDLPSLAGKYAEMFPVGVAIDERETLGSGAELTLRHFNQITAENHMKPEAWYDEARAFRLHPQAKAMMDFAQENDLGMYGHVLVWHSQTPAWFFEDAEGVPLTSDPADQQILRDRMRTHIDAIADALADEYGLFGSDSNPLIAWDVVNEVVSDSGEFSDGLRRSEWYRILGEDFIDLAFEYADDAFNDRLADPAADRPVALFINDYNTEQGGKQTRYLDLVERLVARDVPIDGVGHQFHLNLSMPVETLAVALDRFAPLGLTQAVTELDVTTGTPVTTARLIDQGYYYRDAFRTFAERADDLFSVTVWGLTDDRSWRDSSGAPLLFDSRLQAKPAYYGAMDAELDPRIRSANVFAGSVPLTAQAPDDVAWRALPLHQIATGTGFQLRWAPDHLSVFATVADPTVDATDQVEILLDGAATVIPRSGGDGLIVRETTAGWEAVAHVPLTDAARGQSLDLDVLVTDGDTELGWGDAGVPGTATLVEALSYLEVAPAATAPTIDGLVDDAWAAAGTVVTTKQVQGSGGAFAEVRTLWQDNTLFVLADVTDPVVDVSGSDPWIQDSVEIYVDAGNYKNGPYRYDDTQIRISAENVVSFGTGDEAFQQNRLESAVVATDAGYRVEAAISLLEEGGLDSFHGLDFQVNDASEGARSAIRNWADPTGAGYQSTARWGVGRLVTELTPVFVDVPALHPFATEIAWLADAGIATGYPDGTFGPGATVSRQALAAFLYRASEGGDAPECTSAPFTDVPVDHPFCGPIAWLKDEGIAQGYSDGSFGPGLTVSRQAAVAYLARMSGAEAAECTEAPFSDVPVGHPFCSEIAAIAGLGITGGYADGTFRPTAIVSRQAMAAFLYRAVVEHDLFADRPTPPEDVVPGGATNPVATPVVAARPVDGATAVAALTFDDGPNPGETEDLLDFLADNSITATFCVIGQNIEAPGGAEILRRIVDEGHTLCNHTTSFADMGSWTVDDIQADLVANLAIIREALGDPNAPVPYFRAPNGSWGATPGVAVALGMQPLAVVNTISDWETQVEETLTTNLRGAMTDGQIVLAHDGGGDRTGTVAAVRTVVAEKLAAGWAFSLPAGGIE